MFVSSELGPVLLLGGPGEAASTAERAVALSAALNALVTNAQTKPPAFELRERPQPGGGRRGRGAHVPRADARGRRGLLEELGDRARRRPPRGPGRRGPPLGRAAAGLLRPVPLPAAAAAASPISPRGKVLTEIYGEANRRAPGGNNVPGSVVLPTPRAWRPGCGWWRSWSRATPAARRWRSRAAGTGRSRTRTSASALPGAHAPGGRPARGDAHHLARLDRAQGRRCATSASSAASVSFTVDLQGTAFRFRGTLENNTVTGTIERAGKPPARFTLQFVE